MFYILCILFFPIFSWAQINGSVPAGATLTADEKSNPWLSPSGDFAFGFKQLQNKDQFLLSIWFNKIPDQTVAWYPNSTNPVVPRGSSVRVDPEAGLVLLDSQNKELWRTQGIDSQTNQGFMIDTGNFILQGNDGSWLWESFKVYADTILPGQEVVSRLLEISFSSGRFFLRMQDDGNFRLVCFSAPENNGLGVGYYSSNTADALNSSNSGFRAVFDESGFIYVRLRNNQTKQLSPNPGLAVSDYYFRAKLEIDGVFILYSHPRSVSGDPKWTSVWSVPDNICLDLEHTSSTGACGYNSICSLEEKRAVCNCSIGYDLVNPDDKFGDCKPNFNPTCDGSEIPDLQILEDVHVDYAASDYKYMNTITEDLCRQTCLKDCFCAVAIFVDNECWLKMLPLSNGRRNATINSKVFIKSGLTRSTQSTISDATNKDKRRWTAAQSSLLGSSLFVNFAFLGVICLGSYLIYRKKKKKKSKFQPNVAAIESNLRCFTFNELAEATSEFQEELGRGSYGVVYKGELAGRFVAVKKLNRLAQEKEFRAEVNTIGKTNQKNLVRLLGFCDEGLNRLLVYEYMCNGTLASFIFLQEKPSWNMRKQIAIGIARGLVYLHEECSNQIIHCDIKPQNILLDDYYNVRISDFGLAKLLDTSQSKVSLTNIRGTRGYVAPEWFRNSQVSAKVDVYSFGVLLLEIIACRKCIEKVEYLEEEKWGEPLTDLAWDCFQAQCLDKFVGKDAEALMDQPMLTRFVMVGLWCIQENSNLRPTMRQVNQMLEGIVEVEIPPCPSPFDSSV